MSDLIRREDAIKAVAQDLMYESCVQSEYASDELSDWIEVAKDILEGVPSADRPQEWIPCSERMPENGHYYLWCSDSGSVQRDYYWNGFEKAQEYGYNIVAWMPLPKPWKGADDEP